MWYFHMKFSCGSVHCTCYLTNIYILVLDILISQLIKNMFGNAVQTAFPKNSIFFLLKFNMICTFWIVLMCWCQKWFLKNKKKYHWHAFRHKKLFEKQPLPHCQAPSKSAASSHNGKNIIYTSLNNSNINIHY